MKVLVVYSLYGHAYAPARAVGKGAAEITGKLRS